MTGVVIFTEDWNHVMQRVFERAIKLSPAEANAYTDGFNAGVAEATSSKANCRAYALPRDDHDLHLDERPSEITSALKALETA